MPFRTLAEAAALTQDELLRGVATALITANETLAFVDIIPTDRPSITLNRESAIGSAQVAGCDTELVSESGETIPADFPMRTYIRQFEVCRTVRGLASTFIDQLALDTRLAAKGAGYKIAMDLISGLNANTEVIGWASQTIAGQSVAQVGGSLDLSDLDAAWDRCLVKGAKMAWVGNAATRRAVVRELRANSALQYQELAGTTFTVPQYMGAPVLRNDNVPAGVLYLVNMSAEDEGYGLFMANTQGEEMEGLFGLIDVGWVKDKDRKSYRLVTDIAGVLQSPLAIARITGVA
jgi:hypothetical protein